LPECDAIWLPGGYPELHGKPLAANRALWAALAKHFAAGKPLFAECGGMMALFETLVDIDGQSHWLGSLIPGTVTMQKKLAALGMQEVTLDGHPPLRGHTFHFSTAQTAMRPFTTATKKQGASEGEPVYRLQGLTASYLHLYFPSSPVAAASLFLDAGL
jgi:cobyrinic acid a,c-diamide synthase